MGLVDRLKTESGDELARLKRRYVELLRDDQDDDAQATELRRLAFALDKTAADVRKDQETIARVKALRRAMRAGRGLDPQLTAAAQRVHEHQAETRKLVQDRQRELDALAAERDRIGKLQSDAREAVAQINQLRGDGETAELLADEPAADLAELA